MACSLTKSVYLTSTTLKTLLKFPITYRRDFNPVLSVVNQHLITIPSNRNMSSTNEFSGKKVLVTGGANGLGKAFVKKFYEEGADVFVLDRDGGALASLSKEFPKVTARQVDLLNWVQTQEVIKEFSPLHHLVNNAGVFIPGALLDVTMDNFDTTFGVNIKAAVNVTQAFVKGNGDVGGTIVNISSYADTQAVNGAVSYNCSKAALAMLTKCMALELGPKFRVNCIRPSAMITDMMINIMKSHPEFVKSASHFKDRCILKERVEVADCAELVFFLSSSKSGKITGVGVGIDGGMGIS